MEEIIVVLRSANERTLNTCKNLLLNVLPSTQIETIQEIPFNNAVKKCYEIGLNSEKEWLLTIDADVLVSEEGVKKLINKSFETDKRFFQIQGLILDKFFPIVRPSGIHIYRTCYLEEALRLVPDPGTSLRPESHVINAMRVKGHPWLQSDCVVGIHDFEQSYQDIFRKCHLQAKKHQTFIEQAISIWERKRKEDLDFQIAIWGAKLGAIHSGTVQVSKNFLNQEIEDLFKLKKIVPKSIIDKPIEVDKILSDSSNYDQDLQETMFPASLWNQVHSQNSTVKKNSFLKRGFYFLARQCTKFGDMMP